MPMAIRSVGSGSGVSCVICRGSEVVPALFLLSVSVKIK